MLRLAATSVCDEQGMRKQLSFGSKKKKVLKRRLQAGDMIMGGGGGNDESLSPSELPRIYKERETRY